MAPLDIITLGQVQAGYDSDYTAAQSNYDKAKMNEEQDWKNLLRHVEDVNMRLALSMEIEKLQEQKLKRESERFKNGRTITLQLLNFEEDYNQAQLNRLRMGMEKLLVEAQAKFYNAE